MDINVMLVDDNGDIRESVDLLFQSVDMKIITAVGGVECLSYLKAGFKGLILMDIMMPGLDGWDTIREIVDNGLYEGNIIIMLTAKGEPDTKMEGLQEYVTDYITKPFDPQELIKSVNYYRSLQP